MIDEKIINKKILVIVPHQDDEINLAGGFIYTLSKNNKINVVYTTNGDYNTAPSVRYREAEKALKKLGVNKKNIYFLGYPDTSYNEKNHMFHSNDFDYISKSNHSETYGIKRKKEYCFYKHGIHRKYKRESLVTDLKEIIIDKKPDIIVCIDLDYHCDHIMTSICFEQALGEILNRKDNNYFPIVLKGFAYENSYVGPKDFNQRDNKKMIFNEKDDICISNPYYTINQGIDFKIDKKCYEKNLLINPVWKAIKMHRSQIFVSAAYSVINANNFFFVRNTNNLLYNANIKVSSNEQDKRYLTDFIINDSTNIMNGNKKRIKYDKSIWIPSINDEKKSITIQLDKRQYVYQLNIFQGNNCEDINNKICVIFNNKKIIYEMKKHKETIIIDENIEEVAIIILEDIYKSGISEIELLSDKEIYSDNNYDILPSGNGIVFRFNNLIIKIEEIVDKIIRKIRRIMR